MRMGAERIRAVPAVALAAGLVVWSSCTPVNQAWHDLHNVEPISFTTGVVAGEVTDAGTGFNLERARVDLLTAAGEPVEDQAPTAWVQDGRFRFSTALPGRYLLRVSAEGYAAHVSDPVVVEVGQTIRLRSALRRAGTGVDDTERP